MTIAAPQLRSRAARQILLGAVDEPRVPAGSPGGGEWTSGQAERAMSLSEIPELAPFESPDEALNSKYRYYSTQRPLGPQQAAHIAESGGKVNGRFVWSESPLPTSVVIKNELTAMDHQTAGNILKDNYHSQYGKPSGAYEIASRSGNRGMMIHPSSKEKGKWQATTFDPRGFIGDTVHDTLDQAMTRAAEDGFHRPKPGLLERAAKQQSWAEGSRAIQKLKEQNESIAKASTDAEDYAKNGTNAAAFKKWFGDWENDPSSASKVVDREGKPEEQHGVKELYHGTEGDFSAFDKNKAGSNGVAVGKGFYFTDNPEIASMFAQSGRGKIIKAYLNIRAPFDFDSDLSAANARGLAKSANSIKGDDKAIARHDHEAPDFGKAANELQEAVASGTPISKQDAWRILARHVGKENVNEILSRAGWDGIAHRSRDLGGTPATRRDMEVRPAETSKYGKVWIAFEPTQIKAVANRGTFDPANPNINLSLRSFASQQILLGNPGQPRDYHGRWTSVGGADVHVADDTGQIMKGPTALLGKTLDEAQGHREPAGRPGYHKLARDAKGGYHHPDPQVDARAKALHLAPGYKGAEINADPKADLQAIATDAKGRAQYKYSADHSERQAVAKFARVKDLVAKLPEIQARVKDDPSEEAAVIRLVSKTGLRIGSEADTGADKQAYGATTLRAEHVKDGGKRLAFVGKKGVDINHELHDEKLANELNSRAKSGGKLYNTTDAKVRGYLHSIAPGFKVKDFRTAVAANEAQQAMKGIPSPTDIKSYVKAQQAVAEHVSSRLGNTPAVALKAYIPPEVFSPWKAKVANHEQAGLINQYAAEKGIDPNKAAAEWIPQHAARYRANFNERFKPGVKPGKLDPGRFGLEGPGRNKQLRSGADAGGNGGSGSGSRAGGPGRRVAAPGMLFGRLKSFASREILLSNPNHVPAGQPDGGEFASGTGNDGGRQAEGGSGGSGQGGARGEPGTNSGRSGSLQPPESASTPEGFSKALRKAGVRGGSGIGHAIDVMDAAKKSGAYIARDSLDRITSRENVGGAEHDVHFDPVGKRYYKLTTPNESGTEVFGLHNNAHDYLKGMQRLNELNPALDIKVHGVTETKYGSPSIITSANRMEGVHPSRQELADHLRGQGWEFKPGSQIMNTWQDSRTGAKIADAHPGNFIKTPSGKIVPIDVHYTPGRKMTLMRLRSFAAREIYLSNPYHVPAGSPQGGEFTSAGQIDDLRQRAASHAESANRERDAGRPITAQAHEDAAKAAHNEANRLTARLHQGPRAEPPSRDEMATRTRAAFSNATKAWDKGHSIAVGVPRGIVRAFPGGRDQVRVLEGIAPRLQVKNGTKWHILDSQQFNDFEKQAAEKAAAPAIAPATHPALKAIEAEATGPNAPVIDRERMNRRGAVEKAINAGESHAVYRDPVASKFAIASAETGKPLGMSHHYDTREAAEAAKAKLGGELPANPASPIIPVRLPYAGGDARAHALQQSEGNDVVRLGGNTYPHKAAIQKAGFTYLNGAWHGNPKRVAQLPGGKLPDGVTSKSVDLNRRIVDPFAEATPAVDTSRQLGIFSGGKEIGEKAGQVDLPGLSIPKREVVKPAKIKPVKDEPGQMSLFSRLRSFAARAIFLDRAAPEPKDSVGTFGDEGRFVTVGEEGDRHVIFIPDGAGHVPSRVKAEPDAKNRFSRAAIQRTLLEHHKAVTGESDAYTDAMEQELTDAAGSATDAFRFYKHLPADIKQEIAANPALGKPGLFTVTDDRSKAHGEDAYGSLGDRYIQIAEAKAGSPIRAALQTARESYDPEIQHLAAIHENMPEDPAAMKARATKLRKLADKGGKGKAGESPATLRARADRLEKMAKETPTTEALKAGGLRVGDELSHGGQKYRVAEDESGMRVLRGHEYGESTPVDALTHVPHDKGSFKPGRPTKAPKVEKYPEPEPAGAREEIPFSRVFGRLASYAAREILLGNPNHVPAGSPGGGEFAIAGLSLGKAAALAERHGHENAKARIASRPSGWVGEIERLKRVERANAKEARDTNWKPNENQREVLGWIGKTRHGKFSEAADVPMFKQYRASTQALIKRGIVARNEMPDGIHYSVAIKIHDSLSRLRSHSAREIFLSLEDEPRDDHGRWESAGGLFPPTSKFRQTAADLAADAENDLDRIAATRHSARADKGTFATKTISGKGDLTTMPAEYAAQMQRARRYAADRGGTIREQEKGLGGLRSALRAGQYEKTGANVERWSNEQASELANSVGEHRAAAAYHDRMSHGDKPDAHGAAALAHKAAAQALVNAGREKGGGVASKAAREASKRAHAGPELDDFSALLSRVTLKSFAGREIWLSGEWRTLPNGVHVEINPSGAIDKGPEVPDRKAYSVATSGAGTHRVTVAPSEGGGFDVVHEPPGHDLRKPFPATHHNDVNSANSAAHAKAMEIRTRIQPYRQPMMQESIPGHIIAAGGKEYPGTAAPESQVPAKHAKQSAYAFADPAGDAARNVVPQKIETPRGDRYVHTMESTPELEKVADSPEKPDWMTVRNVGGKRMISVWGKTAGDVKDRAGHAMLGKVSDSETVRLAGDTFRNKQVIRDSGFNWDKDKKQWTGPKWKMPPTKGVHRIAIQLGRFEIGDAEILLAMEARVPAGRPGGGEWTSTGSKANSIYEHEHAAAYHRQRSSEAEGDANETSYLDTAEGANRSRKLRNLGEAHKAAENAHRHAASTNSDAASSLARAASLKADRMDAKLHGKRFVGLSFMPRSFAAREVIGAGPERLRSFASRHILLDRAEAKGPPDYYRTIDSKIVPFWGTDPNPAESARWEKHRAAEIDKAMAERKARTIHVATKAGDHVIEHDATKVHHTSPEGETATEHHNTQGDARRAAAAKAAHIEAEAHKAGSHLKTETAIPIDEETAAGIKAGHLTVPTEGGEIDPHLAEAYSRHAAKQGYKVGEWKVNKDTGEATATVTKASAKPATVPAERMSESDIKQARESFAERAGWKPRSQAAKAAAKSEMDEINERLDRMAQELNAKAEAKDAAARASKAAARATGNPEPAKPAGAAGEKPVQSTPDKETNAKPDDRSGSGGVGEGRAEDRGRVAGKVEPSGDQGTVEGGQDSRQPADNKAPERVPAEIGRVNQKIDRLTKFLRGKGDHERAELLEQIRAHVNNVGVKSALESLGEDKGTGTVAQYEGAKDLGEFGDFARNYLNRNGIQITGYEGRDGTATATPRIKGAGPVVSTEPKSETGVGGVKKGDTFIKHPTLKNKLEEAQHLPGLEKSEAIPEGVTHLTPEVMKGFDEKFGKGKWVAKPYGDNAAAGTGVLFPQRAEQIQRDAQNTIWDAGSEVAKYGFSLDRNKAGKVIGLVHQNGDKYKFGSEKYNNTINGDVRHWADRAAAAAENEHGAALAGGGKEYMVQPAFNVGASDADRAAGKTILAGEGRVHVVTRNGKAEAVPGATFLKGEKAFNPTPEVFETEHTRAMAKAAEDAINALPASERNGQIYAPDVVKTDQGYKVVEANPANETGKSGPLGNSPYAIDAYVSHMTGQSPAHTRFVRSLLTKGNHDSVSSTGEGSGRGSKGGAASGAAPDAGAGKGGGHAKFKGGVSAAEAKSPEEFARVMESSGVEHKPDEIIEDARDEDQAESDRSHNRQVLNSAKASGAYIPPEKFRSVASGPNVGGWEHDVHHDAASDRYYKFNKGDTFGNFGDVHQYIRNAQQMNKLAPDLDIKVHGVTQGAKGQAQVVTSAARINGSAPSNDEVIAHLRSKGWKPVKGGEYHDGTPYAWRDPESGTKIHDTQGKNWIKTDSGKMVPIDIGITKGKQDPQSLSRFVPRSLAAKGVCGMPRLRSFAARELCPA